MNLSARQVVRLARFTRRFKSDTHPIQYKWCRRLLRYLYRRGDGKKPRYDFVVPYDRGLINVDTGQLIDYCILFHGHLEPTVVDIIKRVVRPGDTCIDVGANVGVHTLVMAFQTGPSGRVIAVEPDPQNFRRLRMNVDLNGARQVSLVEAAVSDRDGIATFFTCGPDAANRSLPSLKPVKEGLTPIQVRAIRGATLAAELDMKRCDFIKVDTEGHDLIVLREFADLIQQHRPFLIFEHNKRLWDEFEASAEDALRLLARWHYDLYIVQDGTLSPATEGLPDKCNVFCVPQREGEGARA